MAPPFNLIVRLILLHLACGEIYMPSDYDADMRPNFEANIPDNVFLGINVYSFGPVDETASLVTLDMDFRLVWTDPRLIDVYHRLVHADSKHQKVFLGEKHYQQMWQPDFHFPDAIELSRPVLEDAESLQLTLNKTGGVNLVRRLVVTFRCPMNLHYFPMDNHACTLKISQYKYSTHDQSLSWYQPADAEAELRSPHFEVNEGIQGSYFCFVNPVDGLSYPQLAITISFYRKVKQYLVTLFLPSFCLTVLAFLNFWIDKSAVPARASLSITAILAQITLVTGLAQTYPSGSDIRIADIYLLINFFFTFSTLLEFAIVSYSPKTSTPPEGYEAPEEANNHKRFPVRTPGFWHRSNADIISRYFYPPIFTLWNICFFLVAFHISDRILF